MSANYYLLTWLPPLGEPGAPPPLSPAELREHAVDTTAGPLVDVVLLADDLRQRQARLAGEIAHVEPAVLVPDQVAGWAPLPAVLGLKKPAGSRRLRDDLVWEAYWLHAAREARRHRSDFLSAWVRAEVGLRNRLAVARAQPADQPAERHQVAAHLGADDPLMDRGIAAWASAGDPLVGWRSLLRARWEWASREEPRFSFHRDEVAAYAVKLLLLRDWWRTMGVAA